MCGIAGKIEKSPWLLAALGMLARFALVERREGLAERLVVTSDRS